MTLTSRFPPSDGYSSLYHLEAELLLGPPSLIVPVNHSETAASAALQEIFNTDTALSLISTKCKLLHSSPNFNMMFLTLGNSHC